MRITHRMLSQSALNGLQTNLHLLSTAQRKAVTGKRVHRPHDDPFAVERSLGYRTRLKVGEIITTNIDYSRDWLLASDKALSDMTTLISRAQALVLRATNDTLGPSQRHTLSDEANAMIEQLLTIANTRHGLDYLFSGFQVHTPPFEAQREPASGNITGVVYNGDAGQIIREVEPGVDLPLNVVGEVLFPPLFDTLIQLRDALVALPFDAEVVSAMLDDLDQHMNEAINHQAVIGTKLRRLEAAGDRAETANIGLQELLSKAEDADMAEVLSQLAQQQFVYQTALAINAQVLRLSLLDYLK